MIGLRRFSPPSRGPWLHREPLLDRWQSNYRQLVDSFYSCNDLQYLRSLSISLKNICLPAEKILDDIKEEWATAKPTNEYDELGWLLGAICATDACAAYLGSSASFVLDGCNLIPDEFCASRDAVAEHFLDVGTVHSSVSSK